MNSNKKIALLIIVSSLLRMVVAGMLELGNDEVYYQAYARHLQWNYFDHPPMVALLIRLSTFNLFFHHEFFIRLGAILCAAVSTWLIFNIGSRIKNARTGLIAAILYTTSFYSSVIAGLFILPDSPQALFWMLSMYCMIRILDDNATHRKRSLYFILLGISIGLCIMSKVHGVFLWLGFYAYIIFSRKKLLKSPMLWISSLITIAIISPIYFWNLKNHFITYTYHQGRISFWGNQPDMDHFLQQLLGSVFYSNPVNFLMYVVAVYSLLKNRIKKLPVVYPLFLWLSLPLILLLLWTSLFNDTLPHWSGPAYFSLMLLAAFRIGEQSVSQGTSWLKTAGWVYGVVVIGGALGIMYLPFRIGSSQTSHLGQRDITLDMSGWKTFAIGFDSLYEADIHSGIMKPDAAIISDYWFPAGHLDHYCGIPYHRNLLVFGPLNNIHHFAWLNERRPRLAKNSDAYFIFPTNEYGPPNPNFKNEFTRVEDSLLIPQLRNGHVVRYFVIYRMHGFRGDSIDYLIPGMK